MIANRFKNNVKNNVMSTIARMIVFGSLLVMPANVVARELNQADKEAKARITESADWLTATHAFHEWLSVQTVYSEWEVEELKRNLKRQIEQMTANQLQSFLRDMQAKLGILMSNDASEAREWIGSYMSALAAGKRRELQEKLPDVKNMTATQMTQFLAKTKQVRDSKRQQSANFNRAREQQVQMAKNINRQRTEQMNQALQSSRHAAAQQANQRTQQLRQQSQQNARDLRNNAIDAMNRPGLNPYSPWTWGGYW